MEHTLTRMTHTLVCVWFGIDGGDERGENISN